MPNDSDEAKRIAARCVSRAERFLRAIDCIHDRDRLVLVRSWLPHWDGQFICWPSMLLDGPAYRSGVSPCWDKVRIRLLFAKARLAVRAVLLAETQP